MNHTLDSLSALVKEMLDGANSTTQLEQLDLALFGRNGQFNLYFQALDPADKKLQGAAFNQLKLEIKQALDLKKSTQPTVANFIDPTTPGTHTTLGHLHLITQAIAQIEEIFSRLGFTRRRYPEVESDWYAAEGLNIPKNHPARDDQETFYLSDNIVLTAHTSNGQLREMELANGNLPIRMINIGKTYRRQIDASHSPMFHQFEGMYIDHGVNICNLIAVTDYFVKSFFGNDRQVRLRPHHFQFTEPSFEIDITCGICHGIGCKLCKAGWLELGGAGMIHPNVLKNGKLDPSKVSGFAFGWGVERVLMMQSGLNLGDVRNLYSTDLRVLQQF